MLFLSFLEEVSPRSCLLTNTLCSIKSKLSAIKLQSLTKNLELLLDTQLTFTCSNSTVKTLEKNVKYVQS